MADRAVLRTVRRYLDALAEAGLDVPFAVLFGSHANGTPGPYSDIDLLVVSPVFDRRPHRWGDRELLGRVALKIDHRIAPIPCGLVDWKEDDEIPIYEVARRTGKKIARRRA